MKKEYKFSSIQSGTIFLLLDDDKITIKRKGLFAFLTHGLKGEKTIMLNQISAIQFKETKTTVGYLQFILVGSQETKGGLTNAIKDENTVVFDGGFNSDKVNRDAREIKNYIEEYNSKKNNIKIDKDDKYDKLSKLKKLLNDNVITQEEFEFEKNKLLK